MKNVQDIYALTPMQEVMLMHAASRESRDVLVNRFHYDVKGTLDADTFEKAWIHVVERHDVLRTAFLWDDLKAPLQVVRQRVDLPFEYLDFSGDDEASQERKLIALREQDGATGLDPRKAPLMRFRAVRLAADRHHLLWSSHHLILDRWCIGQLFEDFFDAYGAIVDGTRPTARNSFQYRNYVRWIKQQDARATRAYWRSLLRQFSSATPATRVSARSAAVTQKVEVSGDALAALRKQAADSGVTIATLAQAGWALLLNRLTGSQDVVFGCVVAGRPPNLAGVESVVGSFVNNLPVRTQMPKDVVLGDWLKRMQQQQYERSPHEHVSPAALQRWSGLPADEPLFDTLLVTLGQVDIPSRNGIEFKPLHGTLTTAYPLTLSVEESDRKIAVSMQLVPGRDAIVPLDQLINGLRDALLDLAGASLRLPLSDLPSFRGAKVTAELVGTGTEPADDTDDARSTVDTQAGRESDEVDVMTDLLRSEWKAALGVGNISLSDDFFDLGGSSLQAASLHARLEAATRKSIPMLALFRSTTLGGMAETLANGNWPLTTDIAIELRKGRRRPPLFCTASPDVNTVGYAMLARYLPDDQPVFVLQAPPETGIMRRLSPAELPRLATRYLAEIRRVQPHGPYHLLGMCVGAQLSHEIAQQIEATGETVAFSGVINTWAHYTVSRRYHLQQLLNAGRWYGGRLRELLRMPPRDAVAFIGGVIERRRDGGTSAVRQAATNHYEPSAVSADGTAAAAKQQGVHQQDAQAADPWIDEFGWFWKDPKAAKYAGTVTVFRQRPQQFWRTGERDLGWARHAERTEVVNIPGRDHLAILREPLVEAVARRLTDRLETIYAQG